MDIIMIFVIDKMANIEGKGENAGNRVLIYTIFLRTFLVFFFRVFYTEKYLNVTELLTG